MRNLNIWLVEVGESLPLDNNAPKMRTSILANKLIEHGHDLIWWTSAFDHYKKAWIFDKDTEISPRKGLRIKALRGCGYGSNFSLSRFIDHRLIARKFKRYALLMPKPDVIVAALPPHDLAYEAVLFANTNKIPVLVDIRDQWPDVYLYYVPAYLRAIFRLFISKEFTIAIKAFRGADGLIAMMNSLLDWGLKYANRPRNWKDKVFYLGYSGDRDNLAPAERVNKILGALKDKFVVVFVGSFTIIGSPAILLSCAKEMSGNKDISFLLIGDGHAFARLSRKAEGLNNVIITGRLAPQEVSVLLRNSHAGVCPMNINLDILGNKTFVYLANGLPIVSSYHGDLKDIIEQFQIGLYYSPNDVQGLCNCINKLYNDPDLRLRLAKNARLVYDELFDSDKIYNAYRDHVERVAEAK